MIVSAMFRLLSVAACCLSITATSLPAQVTGDVDVIQNLLETYGLKTKRGTDPAGDVMLTSRIEGISFDVYFYGCGKNAPCDSVQFSAGFDLPNGLSAEQLNSWNRDRRYGKLYTDDHGDPYLEYDINLDGDGVGPKNFDSSLEIWHSLITDFRNYIGW